jgi:hypothetical protein
VQTELVQRNQLIKRVKEQFLVYFRTVLSKRRHCLLFTVQAESEHRNNTLKVISIDSLLHFITAQDTVIRQLFKSHLSQLPPNGPMESHVSVSSDSHNEFRAVILTSFGGLKKSIKLCESVAQQCCIIIVCRSIQNVSECSRRIRLHKE